MLGSVTQQGVSLASTLSLSLCLYPHLPVLSLPQINLRKKEEREKERKEERGTARWFCAVATLSDSLLLPREPLCSPNPNQGDLGPAAGPLPGCLLSPTENMSRLEARGKCHLYGEAFPDHFNPHKDHTGSRPPQSRPPLFCFP